MIGDRALSQFRRGYYEFLEAAFLKEPSEVFVQFLLQGRRSRAEAAASLDAGLAEGWREIDRWLDSQEGGPDRIVEALAEEYTRLFLGPSVIELNPYESYYLTGRLLTRPLAEVRAFLRKAGFERREEYPEPEDHVAFELEIMRQLILKQEASKDPNEEAQWLKLQAEFLKRHLLVWIPPFLRDLRQAEEADFYRAMAGVFQGFLELERQCFAVWDEEEVRPIEEIRAQFLKEQPWQGPTFNP